MLTVEATDRRGAYAATLLCLGLAATVVATFLPWLRSGRSTRNSYASAAQLRNVLPSGGVTDAALRLWSYVPIVCALAILLVLAGRPRAGAIVGLAITLVAGAVAVAALSTAAHGIVRAESAGPGWTAVSAAVTCAAALACLILFRHTPRRP